VTGGTALGVPRIPTRTEGFISWAHFAVCAETFGDAMVRTPIHIAPLDSQGNGYVSTGIPFDTVVTVLLMARPPAGFV
jgi:hypothetical protein